MVDTTSPIARRAGRPKGIPNKLNKTIKEAILEAAERAGGREGVVGYLEVQAVQNPVAFMSLLGKVLPLQVQGSGPGGEIVFKTVYLSADE